jgi:prepilin-type N-terminal cleavage/methylation domain-containing protein
MDRRPPQPRADERGITLIEVLVVVLIVAILAAIGLPLYLNQRAKAQDVEAKSMAVIVAGALMVYNHDHDTFADATTGDLAAIEPVIGSADGLTFSVTPNTFTVRMESAAGSDGGGPFTIEYDPGGTVRGCATPNRGGCPGDGRW